MQNQVQKRLEKEYQTVSDAIENEELKNVYVTIPGENNAKNYFKWNVTIYGREGTIWEGGEFDATLYFIKDSYPAKPPVFTWVSLIPGRKFYHMNIYSDGHTCIDILNDYGTYKPTNSVLEILIAVENLLYEPNPKSPTDGDQARLFQTNKPQYEELIKEFVKEHMKLKNN